MIGWWIMLACGGADEVTFVRDGIVAPAPTEQQGVPLGDGRAFLPVAWAPGDRVELAEEMHRAPAVPSCVQLYQRSLGDVRRHVARGGQPPDTALAFSPDGRWLAVGTFTGEILVLDGWTGELRARRRLSEALVKQVVWSPDGETLYVGEQAPGARILALDAASLQTRWARPLTPDVGTSTPPPGDDLFGFYSLPAAAHVRVLDDGDLLVAAVHAWTTEVGQRRNRSRLLRLTPDGEEVAAWPTEGSVDGVFRAPQVAGGRVVVPVGRSADGPDPPEVPVGGLLVLAASTLRPLLAHTEEPLEPWFDQVFVWEGLDVDAERALVLLGLGDGRVGVRSLEDGTPSWTRPLGTPRLFGEVPVASSVGFAHWTTAGAAVLTAGSHIPFGAADPALRPPIGHPNENAVWLLDGAGQVRWVWRGPHALQGATLSEEGGELVVGAGERTRDRRTDLFGALLFGVAEEEPGLRAFCRTEGPVFFRHAVSEGRVAVVEHPWRDGDRVFGRYRVTVLR